MHLLHLVFTCGHVDMRTILFNKYPHYRYDSSESLAYLCLLLSDCTDQVSECKGCFSGPPSCNTETVNDPSNIGKTKKNSSCQL